MPANDTDTTPKTHKTIKSFVLRQGRVTSAQQYALDNHWQTYGIDYAEQPLSLNTLFNNDNDIIVEIGFGNGDSLLQQAKNQPEFNFIGIEVHGPGVGHLLHYAHNDAVHNIKIIRHDAVDVFTHQLTDNSLQRIQLFFPDPWQKKRHHKRRIIKPDFIELIHRRLKPGGCFHMATDWQHYARQMLTQMDAAAGFENTAGIGKYSQTKAARCKTKFERRGLKLGHGVWDLIYRKQTM
ncbi:MAG: tRNA (guanosine(46)-N7)-methyltransferase TrmB [Gammaproteobacteria bacterium]|nr:tRNA (guanosine(46)-N7)-methyltransferase TrmB [Gammaproteobacteria bacterium]